MYANDLRKCKTRNKKGQGKNERNLYRLPNRPHIITYTALAGERKFVPISDEHRHGMEKRRLLHLAQCTDSGKQRG